MKTPWPSLAQMAKPGLIRGRSYQTGKSFCEMRIMSFCTGSTLGTTPLTTGERLIAELQKLAPLAERHQFWKANHSHRPTILRCLSLPLSPLQNLLGDPAQDIDFFRLQSGAGEQPAQPRHHSAPTAIVVRTRDRPALLERSLASLAAQTYDALRTIVINDGGASVADLVARFPRTTLIERSQSDYRTAANEAFATTTDATYVGLLDDDDAIAPTHVGALVDALERSGSDLAVCGAVHVFVPAPDDLRITAYAIYAPAAFERSALLIGNLIPGALRVLVRRTAMAAVDGFNTDLAVAADYELWLRLSRASDIVRVAGVNAAYTVFANRANRSLAPGSAQRDALRTIYALHQVGGRAKLVAARATMLAVIERAGGYPLDAPTRLLPTPLSLREKSFQG